MWNNASSKFRISNIKKYSPTFGSNIILTRRDRLLSTPNNLSMNPRSSIQELHTSCTAQTKNLDKRSSFLNSLKNNSHNEEGFENKTSKPVENCNDNTESTKDKVNLLSATETSEEKELSKIFASILSMFFIDAYVLSNFRLLIRMGWNDDMAYEITEKDKEEYEKQIQFLPKVSNMKLSVRIMYMNDFYILTYLDK